MILFHGTNISELGGGALAAGSWLTSDVYTAADFSDSRRGDRFVYVFWLEENEVEFHTFPDSVIPAWRLKADTIPIARLIYQSEKITI